MSIATTPSSRGVYLHSHKIHQSKGKLQEAVMVHGTIFTQFSLTLNRPNTSFCHKA